MIWNLAQVTITAISILRWEFLRFKKFRHTLLLYTIGARIGDRPPTAFHASHMMTNPYCQRKQTVSRELVNTKDHLPFSVRLRVLFKTACKLKEDWLRKECVLDNLTTTRKLRKSEKTVNFTQIQLTYDALVSTCVGCPNGEKLASTWVRIWASTEVNASWAAVERREGSSI